MEMKVKNESFSLDVYSKGSYPYGSYVVVESEINGEKEKTKFATEINPSGVLEVDSYIVSLVKDMEFEVVRRKDWPTQCIVFYLFLPGQTAVGPVHWTGLKVKSVNAAWWWLNQTAIAEQRQDGTYWYRPDITSLGLEPGFLDELKEEENV